MLERNVSRRLKATSLFILILVLSLFVSTINIGQTVYAESNDSVQITGMIRWQGDDANIPENVTVQLLQNNSVYETKIVTADDLWTYSFNAPKYDADMNEYVYTVKEESVDGYRATYDGKNILNTPKTESISLTIIKKEFLSDSPISGAFISVRQFICTNTDADHEHSTPGYQPCWKNLSYKYSNLSGIITIDGLEVGGIYILGEGTDEANELPNSLDRLIVVGDDESITISNVFDQDDMDAFMATYNWLDFDFEIEIDEAGNIVLYSVSTIRTVELLVYINANDINFDNGTPTFIFKLTGTDTNGEVHTYHTLVQFTEDYVNSNTYGSGYVGMETMFWGVPPGNYILSQSEVSRYEVEAVYNVVNGTTNGNIVNFDLILNINGGAMYQNKLYESQWCSDNDLVINTIECGKR